VAPGATSSTRPALAIRHSYPLDASGRNVLAHVTVRRNLLIQYAFRAIAWRVEGAQKRDPRDRIGIQVMWQIDGSGYPASRRESGCERFWGSAACRAGIATLRFVRVGTLDDLATIPPDVHIYVRSVRGDSLTERGGFEAPVPRGLLWAEFGPNLARYSA
jgi:hypothetical protein